MRHLLIRLGTVTPGADKDTPWRSIRGRQDRVRPSAIKCERSGGYSTCVRWIWIVGWFVGRRHIGQLTHRTDSHCGGDGFRPCPTAAWSDQLPFRPSPLRSDRVQNLAPAPQQIDAECQQPTSGSHALLNRAPPPGSTALHRQRPTPATLAPSRASAPDRVRPGALCRECRRRSAGDGDCCRAR